MKHFFPIYLVILATLATSCRENDVVESEYPEDSNLDIDIAALPVEANPEIGSAPIFVDPIAEPSPIVVPSYPSNEISVPPVEASIPIAQPVEQIAPEILESEDFSVFYVELNRFGEWFETADYGYVWQPEVIGSDPSWRPYTRGRWVDSNEGWTWVSDEPFGWATYHYGRWALLQEHGWIWIPGEDWAPAWVSWRKDESHVGWAPLPPETLYQDEHHYDEGIDNTYGISPSWYNFVPADNFYEPVHDRSIPRALVANLFLRSRNITRIRSEAGRIHCDGPDREWLSRQTRRNAPYFTLNRSERPVIYHGNQRTQFSNNQYDIWAPHVGAHWNPSIRPPRVMGDFGNVFIDRDGRHVHADARRHYEEKRVYRYHNAREAGRTEAAIEALKRQRKVEGRLAEEQERLLKQREKAQREYVKNLEQEREERLKAIAKLNEDREEALQKAEKERLKAIEARIKEAEKAAEAELALQEKEARNLVEMERTRQKEAEKIAEQRKEEAKAVAKMEEKRAKEAAEIAAKEREEAAKASAKMEQERLEAEKKAAKQREELAKANASREEKLAMEAAKAKSNMEKIAKQQEEEAKERAKMEQKRAMEAAEKAAMERQEAAKAQAKLEKDRREAMEKVARKREEEAKERAKMEQKRREAEENARRKAAEKEAERMKEQQKEAEKRAKEERKRQEEQAEKRRKEMKNAEEKRRKEAEKRAKDESKGKKDKDKKK